MGEDALGGWENKMSELSGGEDIAGPFFELGEDDIVSGWDDSAFVDSADEFNDNFFASVVIDDFELSDVVVFLHDAEEFDKDFGGGTEEDLFFAFAFSVDDCFEGVGEDVDFHHWILI